jgi:hypothetical protein
MIDPDGLLLGVGGSHGIVDLAAGGEVGSEGFFQREPDVRAGKTRRLQIVDGRLEQAGRGRQEDRDLPGVVANRVGQSNPALSSLVRAVARMRRSSGSSPSTSRP